MASLRDKETESGQEEELTEELLQRLLASASPESYLSETALADRTLATYIGELLQRKHLKKSKVILSSGLNVTHGYQVFQGKRKLSRNRALMLAFALQCDLRETQRLLRLAGVSELWCKVRRDAIVIFCIEHGYTREATDDELYRLGEDTLLPAED